MVNHNSQLSQHSILWWEIWSINNQTHSSEKSSVSKRKLVNKLVNIGKNLFSKKSKKKINKKLINIQILINIGFKYWSIHIGQNIANNKIHSQPTDEKSFLVIKISKKNFCLLIGQKLINKELINRKFMDPKYFSNL